MPYTETFPRIYYEVDEPNERFEPDERLEPLVLIEGLSAQLIGWREGFLEELRSRGFRLIRLDNRDVGLSDKLGEPGDGGLRYSIADMALDVVRVLDAEGISSAHVVGQSMGGAIAQALAIADPERVRSLALFYTAPDFAGRYWGDAVAARRAMPPVDPAASREVAVEARVRGERMCTPPGMFFDEGWVREVAGLSWDRCPRMDGADRQTSALLETADHAGRLGEVRAPTVILHGRADPLVRYEAAIALAELIHGSELHLYPDMPHVVVPPLWSEFATIIRRNASRAAPRDANGQDRYGSVTRNLRPPVKPGAVQTAAPARPASSRL